VKEDEGGCDAPAANGDVAKRTRQTKMHLRCVVGDVDLECNAYALLVEGKVHFASPTCYVLLESVLVTHAEMHMSFLHIRAVLVPEDYSNKCE
jgi:hypothetical protein